MKDQIWRHRFLQIGGIALTDAVLPRLASPAPQATAAETGDRSKKAVGWSPDRQRKPTSATKSRNTITLPARR